MSAYFTVRLTDVEGSWLLDEPTLNGQVVDFWKFNTCQPHRTTGRLDTTVLTPGPRADLSLNVMMTPVVSRALGDALERLAPDSIQRIPLLIAPDIEGFQILNVLTAIDCFDESRTMFDRYASADGPELAGKYKTVVGLHVDPAKVSGAHIFRVSTFHAPLIVSSEARRVIESFKTALAFEPAS